MIKFLKYSTTLFFIFCFLACHPKLTKKEALEVKVQSHIDSISGDVAVAFLNLSDPTRGLGAEKIEVLRGVEDQKAYDLGLNNSTTAKDLLMIIKAIATNSAGTKEDCKAMVAVLKDQQFNEIIPHDLPKDVTVAHKTGSITGVHHDAGIVYLPDGRSYVLVLLSKNLEDFNKGSQQLASISKSIYDYMTEK